MQMPNFEHSKQIQINNLRSILLSKNYNSSKNKDKKFDLFEEKRRSKAKCKSIKLNQIPNTSIIKTQTQSKNPFQLTFNEKTLALVLLPKTGKKPQVQIDIK
mmetsp:Transcript_17167/g.19198  ORF Transcript_17167/g.19198 Transcript_17167/m.19198 type:complete len:102 (+) Transcript_17167:107-412(+)